jgi:hypothetical protein
MCYCAKFGTSFGSDLVLVPHCLRRGHYATHCKCACKCACSMGYELESNKQFCLQSVSPAAASPELPWSVDSTAESNATPRKAS